MGAVLRVLVSTVQKTAMEDKAMKRLQIHKQELSGQHFTLCGKRPHGQYGTTQNLAGVTCAKCRKSLGLSTRYDTFEALEVQANHHFQLWH